MPRTDRSITILTGMIIAALYVILLVGFSRESYMRRDACGAAPNGVGPPRSRSRMLQNGSAASSAGMRGAVSGRERAAELRDLARRRRRIVSEPVVPLTLERLRRAMRDDP